MIHSAAWCSAAISYAPALKICPAQAQGTTSAPWTFLTHGYYLPYIMDTTLHRPGANHFGTVHFPYSFKNHGLTLHRGAGHAMFGSWTYLTLYRNLTCLISWTSSDHGHFSSNALAHSTYNSWVPTKPFLLRLTCLTSGPQTKKSCPNHELALHHVQIMDFPYNLPMGTP
jgi:hypothetical protein